MNRGPLAERSRAEQIVAVVVLPALLGAISGVVLGVSATAYWILQALAALGGLHAGTEHRSARGAALRGAGAGFVYGAFILIAHVIAGTDAKADIGDPEVALAVVTAVAGALLGLGGFGLVRLVRRRG